MTTHSVYLHPMDWDALIKGHKHFLVLADRPYRVGDILCLSCHASPDAILVRVITYVESGANYLPTHVGLEVAPYGPTASTRRLRGAGSGGRTGVPSIPPSSFR